MNETPPTTIDEYTSGCPSDVRPLLEAIRRIVREEAPDAEETIKYRMPTFTLHGKNLVHFAAFKRHIGFYPTSSPMATFAAELAGYKTSRGAIQLPLTQPLPLDLIRRIVAYRVREARARQSAAGKPSGAG